MEGESRNHTGLFLSAVFVVAVSHLLKTAVLAWQLAFLHVDKTVTALLGADFTLSANGYFTPVIFTRSPGIAVKITPDIFLRQIASEAVDTRFAMCSCV